MPATAARIAYVTSEWRRVVATTASVTTRHGTLARESEDPIETFFDNVADAQVVANARQALLSPERRRFQATAMGLDEALALTYTSGVIPNGRYVDAERDADMSVLMAEIGFDFARQQAVFQVWG